MFDPMKVHISNCHSEPVCVCVSDTCRSSSGRNGTRPVALLVPHIIQIHCPLQWSTSIMMQYSYMSNGHTRAPHITQYSLTVSGWPTSIRVFDLSDEMDLHYDHPHVRDPRPKTVKDAHVFSSINDPIHQINVEILFFTVTVSFESLKVEI